MLRGQHSPQHCRTQAHEEVRQDPQRQVLVPYADAGAECEGEQRHAGQGGGGPGQAKSARQAGAR